MISPDRHVSNVCIASNVLSVAEIKDPVHRVSGSVSVTGSGCKPVNSDVCGVEGDQNEGG